MKTIIFWVYNTSKPQVGGVRFGGVQKLVLELSSLNHTRELLSSSRTLFQVFDLSRLRHMNNYSVVYADVTTEHFGNAHNVVGNNETDFIYVVGATERTAYTCEDKAAMLYRRNRIQVGNG